MNKETLVMITIIIIILGITGYFYLNQEDNDGVEYSNITIYAEEGNKRIKTGYIVNHSSGIIRGNTSQSYERLRVPKGIVKIYNENLEGQNYFTNIITENISAPTERIKLDLRKPEEINISINDTKPLEISIYSKYAKEIKFCLAWSLNYIFVKALDFEEIEKIENWDRCYKTNITLENSNATIKVDYTKFGTIKENDYIKLLIINEDKEIGSKIVNIK